MNFRQVKFRTYGGEPDAELGGIAVYKYNHLIGVICGCCGAWHRAKDVQILECYDCWLNFGSVIVEFNDGANDWDDVNINKSFNGEFQ